MPSSANLQDKSNEEEKAKLFVKGAHGTRIHYNPSEAPHYDNEQETLVLSPTNQPRLKAKRSFIFCAAQTLGIILSLSWAAVCIMFLVTNGGISTQTPYELGIFVAGMLAPVAFYWMLLSYLQRNSDVQFYAENLRNELHTLFFPSEEDSQRVNKDIERMTMQASELASSSKAVLKSIQRTRQGLRHEIKEFANFASKAESHLLSLSDNLNGKTATIHDLVDVIDTRINTIALKSEQSIQSWDDASAKMLERAGDIEGTMDTGANRILNMADVALEKSSNISDLFDGTITSLGITVDAVIDRLGGMNEQFGAYTRTLSISTEELAKETGRMGIMIEDHADQLQNAAGKSAEIITQSLINVSEQKDILEDTVNMLSGQSTLLSAAITNSVSELTHTTNDIVSRAEATGDKLSEKTSLISKSLDGLEEQINRIDSVSDRASHRLEEGIETAVNGASQVSEAIRRGIDNLTRTSNEATKEAKDLIDTTIEHIEKLKDTREENSLSIESVVELLEKSRHQINLASENSKSHVDMLSNSIDMHEDKLNISAASLADSVKIVTKALEEPLRMVSIAVADADGRHVQIQETLERRVNDLRSASDKAVESVEIIRTSLREQTNDISKLSGEAISQAKTLNSELHDNKEQLSQTIDTTLSNMNNLIENITTQTDAITNASQKMNGDLTTLNSGVETCVTKLIDTSQMSHDLLEKSQNDYNMIAENFESNIKQSETLIERSNLQLIAASEKILPLYDRIETGSVRAIGALNESEINFKTISDLTLSRIDIVGEEFNKQLDVLETGSNKALQTLKTSTNDLHQKLNDIEHAAETVDNKMSKLSSTMDRQSSDIHILTDQAILKIENVQKLMSDQCRELSESVSTASNQIESVGLSFDEKAGKISGQSTEILARFTAAGEEVKIQAYELKQASNNIADVAEQSVDKISSQMSLLQSNSDSALSNLHKTSDTLSMKSKEIDTLMHSVLSQTKSYASDIKNNIADVAEQSDKSATAIGQSVSTLISAMDNVNSRTKSVVEYISESNQSLYEQSGRFVTAVTKSAQAAEHATSMFSQQTDSMLKAAKTAVEKSQDIQKAELKVGRENFLNSARFVLESLHSLSIDFVRMIDGNVADKDWKSYQKGDIAIFTSKLVERLNDMPADKIRTKYANDTEFRNYVQKFMRQFEDVLEQTDSVDRGAILGTTFAASDVGKIYRFLSNVTGRQNKAA